MTSSSDPLGLRTFDVFDTALTRLVGSPKTVFVLLGRRLVREGRLSYAPRQFAQERVDAEHRARMNSKSQEISLSDIYRELLHVHSFSDDDVAWFCRAELEIEERLLRAVPEIQRIAERERRAGRRIAFVSDTYFPHESVAKWLTRNGVLKDGEVLWTSSKELRTKATGDLFRLVAQSSGVDLANWRHRGDHPVSDVSVPRRIGIGGELFSDCHLNRYETMMDARSENTDGLTSLMAGAARWTRLSIAEESASRRHLRDIAADVGAPVLFAFVSWVLRRARDEGLKRLWFVSRDGQIMLRVARPLAAKLGMDVELGYLYGGRQVVNLAGLETVDDVALEWILGGAGAVTIADLLDRVGLHLDDVRTPLGRYDVPLTGKIPWSKVESLKHFFQDAQVSEQVLRAAERQRAETRDYFASCGLMDGERCGIVDIGWRARVFRAIGKIIGAEHAARHTGLYFGLLGRPNPPPPGRLAAFLFDHGQDPPLGVGQDIPGLTGLMEIFCQADHGQVLSVNRLGAAYQPILRTPINSCGPTWDIALFQKAVETFAETIDLEGAEDLDVDLRGLCEELLRTLLTQPTIDEARTLGGVLFTDDQTGSMSEPLAAPYGLGDCRGAFRSGEWPQKSFNWWAAGARTLTPPLVRACLSTARKLHPVRELPVVRALRALAHRGR